MSSRERRSAAVAVDTLGERQRDKTNDYICCCRKWIAWQQLDPAEWKEGDDPIQFPQWEELHRDIAVAVFQLLSYSQAMAGDTATTS